MPIQRQRSGPSGRDERSGASRSSGKVRSTIRPSTDAASAFFMTLCGSADAANSRTDVPGGTLRWIRREA